MRSYDWLNRYWRDWRVYVSDVSGGGAAGAGARLVVNSRCDGVVRAHESR
jgi:hypothetical protein